MLQPAASTRNQAVAGAAATGNVALLRSQRHKGLLARPPEAGSSGMQRAALRCPCDPPLAWTACHPAAAAAGSPTPLPPPPCSNTTADPQQQAQSETSACVPAGGGGGRRCPRPPPGRAPSCPRTRSRFHAPLGLHCGLPLLGLELLALCRCQLGPSVCLLPPGRRRSLLLWRHGRWSPCGR